MDLSIFLSKHKAMRENLLQINKYCNEGIEKNAESIAHELIKLSAVLNMHLSSEDKFFYPELLSNKDPKIQSVARFYMEEMIGLEDSFRSFVTDYNTGSKILNNVNIFKIAFENVNKALTKRMDKEENELYSLS